MKIATWNVNSLKVRLPQVLDWLKYSQCDVLALQELKIDNDNFPKEEFNAHGYYFAFNGQKTYNGVAIVSKFPLGNIQYDIPGFDDPQKRVISATINEVRIVCVYVVNGESVTSDKFTYKMTWLDKLYNFLRKEIEVNSKLVVLGDFNVAPKDIDVYNPLAWQNQVLCSIPEREGFDKLLSLGLVDSFRVVNTDEVAYTWWDYRSFAFKRKMGLRIDHILVTKPLVPEIINCEIDIMPRKHERPSDHTPVILTLRC
ncbi:MAG TPA: exodeoxyribonuclease III [Burkholderiales bacterium]|nr:exodeoxyribonuclease III [Burkholderiales bacterium]